jgi:Protein kinase domain
MVMPLYRGLTFRQARSHMQAPPSEAWMRTVLWSILGALKYMHEHKTVHRDISPDNIFLQDKGPPVLLDLGAARRAIADSSHRHTAILKVNYAPIEQYAESPDLRQGPWTDLYSLAAVVHGCLCNAPPLPATFRVVRDRMPPFASVAHTVKSLFGHHYSREFVQTITHALALQPEARPQSVQAFVDEMHLTMPQGIQTFSWREGLSTDRVPLPVVDPDAKTVLHEPMAPAVADDYDLPASEAMPLSHMSAYGALDQESAFLATQLVLDPEAELRDADESQDFTTLTSTVPHAQHPSKPFKYAIAGVAGLFLAAGLAFWVWWGRPSQVVPIAIKQSQPAQLPAVAVVLGTNTDSGATTVPLVAPSAVPAVLSAQPEKDALLKEAAPRPAAVLTPKRLSAGAAKPALSGRAYPDAVASPRPSDKSGELLSDREEVAHLASEARKPVSAARPGPAEICANKNFVVRPMCIFRECEKPEFAHQAYCEDARKRWKDGNQSSNP